MIVAVEQAIPYWKEAFSPLGEIRPFDGRKVRPEDIRDADALIVRSVTRVDAALLEGSRVRFVGTATIGTDHLDEAYLRGREIRFTNAAGSNSNAVSEYVAAALVHAAGRRGWDLSRMSIAVIGVGHVGSKVARKARALGMEVALCDPPLRESTGDARYGCLEDVLDADILSLHVPLTEDGPHPTRAMFDQRIFARLAARQFLINTARGPVVRESSLKAALDDGRLLGAVLDVWETEPRIDYTLMQKVDLGTAHIAGYSLDGKVRATEMILEALCTCFGLQPRWDTSGIYPAARVLRPARESRGQELLRSVILRAYDIRVDDRQLRSLAALGEDEARSGFDRLRNEYDLRPEFGHYAVELQESQHDAEPALRELGFGTRAVPAVSDGP